MSKALSLDLRIRVLAAVEGVGWSRMLIPMASSSDLGMSGSGDAGDRPARAGRAGEQP